jgi:hypothetical protein
MAAPMLIGGRRTFGEIDGDAWKAEVCLLRMGRAGSFPVSPSSRSAFWTRWSAPP